MTYLPSSIFYFSAGLSKSFDDRALKKLVAGS